MNTKSASEKGYHLQTPRSLPCTSALPFIIAFSLPFHCHLFCQWKYELWLRRGSEGGVGREMRGKMVARRDSFMAGSSVMALGVVPGYLVF